jgi:hypothetical protein
MIPKHVVTAGDHGSDEYAAKFFPDVELLRLRRGDNGKAAFDKFDELGEDAVLITSTTPLHFSDRAEQILNKYVIRAYYGDLDYILMAKEGCLEYGVNFAGRTLGGISPLIGKLATRLVGAAGYVGFSDPEMSAKAVRDGEIDLVTKTAKNGKWDTETGLHMVCDLTKEFGLKLRYYLVTHKGEHDEKALNVFLQERTEVTNLL